MGAVNALTPHFRNSKDIRTVNLIALYFVLTFILWNYGPSMPLYLEVPLWMVTAFWSFIGATVTHNTMHCRVFKERWANKLWQYTLTLTYGHPVSTYVPGHNLSHHKHTQLEKDIMRTSKMRYKWHFLNGLLFQFSVSGSVLKSDLRFLRLQTVLGRPWAAQALREFTFLFAVQGVLIYFSLWKFFVFFWLPHFFAQWAIVSMNMLQHDGCDVAEEGDTSNPNTSRNFLSPILNYLTMNNGYHGIHHDHPTMHWSEYPEAHEKELKARGLHPNLDQKSMLGFIFKTYIYPGKRVMYDGRPVTFENPVEPPDADWMDYPKGMDPREIDFTWGKAAHFATNALLLFFTKLMDPMYSPSVRLS